jgi:4-amino-4-deoxy-L-arabinose transferase-like glycosyltransferase
LLTIEIFGVPTHPLVVHAAVVLIPLAAIALLGLGWKPSWRRDFSLVIALVAIAGAGAAILAAATGESLEASVRDAAGSRVNFGDHPEQGELARNVSILFAMAAAAFWAVEAFGQRLRLQAWTPMAAYIGSSALGVVAIATIIIAGHSGAALVWKDVGNFVGTRR